MHHTLKPNSASHTLVVGDRYGLIMSAVKTASCLRLTATCFFVFSLSLLLPQITRAVLGTQSAKSALHVWNVGESEAPLQKAVMPERVGPVAASQDGAWLFGGGASGKLYVWALGSGALVNTVVAHYRQITALAVTKDGACVVTGGDDGIIHVWMVSSLVDVKTQGAPTAVHTWTSHGLRISSLYCALGPYGETVVISGSLDSTVKVWKLPQGQLVADIVYPSNITSVALDAFEQMLFAGSSEGPIYCTRFSDDPMVAHMSVSGEESSESRTIMRGHQGAVTSMAVVCHGVNQVLISASTDALVHLWDVVSGQLIGSFRKHTGPVTSLSLLPKLPSSDARPAALVGKLQKYTRHVLAGGEVPPESALFWVRGPGQQRRVLPDFAESALTAGQQGNDVQRRVGELEAEVERLQELNRKLFEFDVDKVLEGQKKRKTQDD